MKTVAVMGTNGGVSFAAQGFSQAFEAIGHNTGNMLFQHALWNCIRDPKFTVAPYEDPARVREMADVLVIPAANQINPAWDLGAWANFIEAVDRPCVVIGLGAQADLDADPALELKPGTVRLLHALRERAGTIGVRGDFTRRVLAHHGVDNTVITGCPSQTINPQVSGRTIAARIAQAAAMDDPRIGYVFGTMAPEAREPEKILSRIAAGHRHEIIYQTDPRILGALHERVLVTGADTFFRWLGQILRPEMQGNDYARYVFAHGRFFSDARSWIDAMREYDVVLGLRIHGAVAAIQSEQPGICIAFDSRTLELAHTMGYPYVRGSDLAPDDTLASLLGKVVFDVARFDHLKIVHGQRVAKILQDAGLDVLAHSGTQRQAA